MTDATHTTAGDALARVVRERGCGDATPEDYDAVDFVLAALRARAAAADTLADALRPFAEEWDLHATDYLAELIDGKEMRVIEATIVAEMIDDIGGARSALAAYDAANRANT